MEQTFKYGEKEFYLNVNKEAYIYADDERIATNGKYTVIGVHDSNPGCYKYLDQIIVLENATGRYELVPAYTALSGGTDSYNSSATQLKRVWLEDNAFFIKSDLKKVQVQPEIIMAENVKPGTVFDNNEPDKWRMETCFRYTVTTDMGILMELKVPVTDCPYWPGFDLEYDVFKVWGAFGGDGQAYLLFGNSKTGKSWTIEWGGRNTSVSDYMWQRRDALLECIKKTFPNHPAIRKQLYLKK